MTQNTVDPLVVIRNDIALLVDQANEREISIAEVQHIYRSINRSISARNWDGLKAKLNGLHDLEKLNDLHNQVENLVAKHVFFDDKLITIYKDVPNIDEINISLKTLFDNAKNESSTSEIGVTYQPLEELVIEETVIFYQFAQIRELSIKEQLDPDDLKEDIVTDYQEVYGVKKVSLACYDSVIVNLDTNTLIFMIDLAQVMRRNELNVTQNNFNRFIKNILGSEVLEKYDFFAQPLDLFPCIQKFYDEPVDENTSGVSEINFTTPAGTAHYEKLRGDSKDLRTATYHKSGVAGLRDEEVDGVRIEATITPYRISKKYYGESHIEISLKSSYVAINTENGSHLYDAFLCGTRSYEDLEFAIQKLLTLR